MLFKTRFHADLRDGSINLTFRKWSRAQVKIGGSYRFDQRPGAIVVDSIDQESVGKIMPPEIKRAGFESLDELKAALRTKGTTISARTSVFRVAFHFERGSSKKSKSAAPNQGDVDTLVERLERMDTLSRRGPWTKQVLALIAKHPQRRAGDLAPSLDRELKAFKTDVRKLKGLGLTKSFEVGYELTAFGRLVLKAM
ncbi:MAG: hypothetical protein O7G85_07025 [Planctomycetota bacterium]|nr:hypothetical protein [Planctomycetota bacterium]